MDDYPLPGHDPMAATALTDAERWPLLTGEGAAMLERLRGHPHAPRYNHVCGDRIDGGGLARLRAFEDLLGRGRDSAAGRSTGHRHGWPSWSNASTPPCRATVPPGPRPQRPPTCPR